MAHVRVGTADVPGESARRDGIVLDLDSSVPSSSNSARSSHELVDSFQRKTARVAVIGLGYVGLPLVQAFTDAGFPVVGFDIDPEKVAKLSAGQSYIQHVPSEQIARLVANGTFRATDDFSKLRDVDAIVICVPTPLTDSREPDLGPVIATAQAIGASLRPGQLVVLESTTYPGTTERVVRPILENTGLRAGSDFYLAFSPEREDPGNARFSTRSIPKVVGAVNEVSLEVATALYTQVVTEVIRVSSTQVAEACKILENTYRAVNIALVNELKMLFHRMGIDIWEVIRAASTKPFGFQPFYPGPGLGGHCIPIDPFYLTWVARQYEFSTRFIELAGEINTAMPDYVVSRVVQFLNEVGKPLKGSRILVLGVAYKRDVDDPRESPSFVVIERLLAQFAILSYNDPHVPQLPKMRHHKLEMSSTPLSPEALSQQDCVLILTDHSAYDWQWIVDHSKMIVDTRNATRHVESNRDRIRSA